MPPLSGSIEAKPDADSMSALLSSSQRGKQKDFVTTLPKTVSTGSLPECVDCPPQLWNSILNASQEKVQRRWSQHLSIKM